MKLNLKIFIVCALVIAFSGLSFGQNFTTYKHPSLNIQLRAADILITSFTVYQAKKMRSLH